jgi:hypothetical protein
MIQRSFTFLFILLLFFSCSRNEFSEWNNPGRNVAANYSYDENQKAPVDIDREYQSEAKKRGHTLEYPPGLTKKEASRLWHIGEGSEIYPTLWMQNLVSSKSNRPGTFFLEDLDKKFGIIKDPTFITAPFPISTNSFSPLIKDPKNLWWEA